MILGLIVFAAVFAALAILMKKSMENTFGSGLGRKNNEEWGIDDK